LIEGYRFVEQGDAQRAGLIRRMPVRAALLDERPKVGDIHPQGRACFLLLDQFYLVAVRFETARAEHFVEHGEVTSQVGKGQRRGRIGPKKRNERFASVNLAGDGEIGQQGQRLATTDLERLFILLEARRTEKV
jgi:hypothetical protein